MWFHNKWHPKFICGILFHSILDVLVRLASFSALPHFCNVIQEEKNVRVVAPVSSMTTVSCLDPSRRSTTWTWPSKLRCSSTVSGSARADTTDSPRPKLAVMIIRAGLPSTGLTVNSTPAASEATISCTTTPIPVENPIGLFNTNDWFTLSNHFKGTPPIFSQKVKRKFHW